MLILRPLVMFFQKVLCSQEYSLGLMKRMNIVLFLSFCFFFSVLLAFPCAVMVSTRSVAEVSGRKEDTKGVFSGLFFSGNLGESRQRLGLTAVYSLLQEVESPGFGDSLGAALHAQFAAD